MRNADLGVKKPRDLKPKGGGYGYLNTRSTRQFPTGGCMHAIRRWVFSDNHNNSRGTLGYLTACAGLSAHEGQHRTADGYSW